ncbi:glycosyltransferase [Cohnella sp. CFH 77786]|uniref:glycosyltransferase family 2 protein n=1 Tax=Cohnella sp. CFH 77786 TaxID=2662265 RepID=UPI001C61030B|nr:glycosyltransferase [Cohnella sp. CFH 77786]MBW5448386.1 glycosyltransferase [Cohnella sp. CFH 77786]
METTVAICTHNRAADTVEAINSVLKQNYPRDRYEVVVVDNRSSDDIASLVRSMMKEETNLRYVFEERLGLSYARNRAIDEARGENIVFLDDDALAGDGWLRHMRDCLSIEGVACAGGKIIPQWESGAPGWLPDEYKSVYTILDYSDTLAEMKGTAIPYGANMGFKTEVIRFYGGFRTDLGRSGKNLLSGEESELIHKIKTSHAVYYTPKAVVFHKISAKRTKLNWFMNRMYWQGVSDAIRFELSGPRAFSKAVLRIGLYVLRLPLSLSRKRAVLQLAKIALQLGILRELVKGTRHSLEAASNRFVK